jgi:hypothetical protein
MSVRLHYLDGPAGGIVQETNWCTALPSLYWPDPDRDEPGIIYDRPDSCTWRWLYRCRRVA